MTRLKTEWISEIEKNTALWDCELRKKTGLGFSELAAEALLVGTTERTELLSCNQTSVYSKAKTNIFENRKHADKVSDIRKKLYTAAGSSSVAVIPVTSGDGVIASFAQSVASIVKTMGFEAFVTENCDVGGIREAYEKNADVIYMADDDAYIAVNTKNGRMGDNNIATACGYAKILDVMAGGLLGRRTAVLGYGIIGRIMAEKLETFGAEIFVYDKNSERQKAAEADGFGILDSVSELRDFLYIADATNEGGWITPGLLHEKAVITAPGVPLSLSEDARRVFAGRYVHDMLEIGTACMMGFVV